MQTNAHSEAPVDLGSPFAVWVRRSDGATAGCAIRFEVTEGKGVLRVARPGVLIVPPARVHGFEDNLTPDQIRSSQFLHIPRPGARRSTYKLTELDDDSLAGLDADVWYMLQPSAGSTGALTLDFGDDGDVIALGGSGPDDETTEPPGSAGTPGADADQRSEEDRDDEDRDDEDSDDEASDDEDSDDEDRDDEDVGEIDSSIARVAGIVEVVKPRNGGVSGDIFEDLLDEVIAADPETVDSMLGPIVLDDAELQRLRARARIASESPSDAVEAPELPPMLVQPDGAASSAPADDGGPSVHLTQAHPRLRVEGGRLLVRKLRFELERRQREIADLKEQVAELQARLLALQAREGDAPG